MLTCTAALCTKIAEHDIIIFLNFSYSSHILLPACRVVGMFKLPLPFQHNKFINVCNILIYYIICNYYEFSYIKFLSTALPTYIVQIVYLSTQKYLSNVASPAALRYLQPTHQFYHSNNVNISYYYN